jgi:hypothetical protein
MPFHYCTRDAFLRGRWLRGDGRRDWNAETASVIKTQRGQLCLRIERASSRIFRMTIKLEIVKQIFRSLIGL